MVVIGIEHHKVFHFNLMEPRNVPALYPGYLVEKLGIGHAEAIGFAQLLNSIREHFADSMIGGSKMSTIAVYRWGPGLSLHEGDWEDWDFKTFGADEYRSPRAEPLYRALGADPSDPEYNIAIHRQSGRWGVFNLRGAGHPYAVETE